MLTNQYIINLGPVGDWTPDETINGCVEYCSPKSNFTIFATPNWDADGFVSVASYDNINEEYRDIMNFRLIPESVDEQLKIYINMISIVFEEYKQ